MKLTYQRTNYSNLTFSIDGKSVTMSFEQIRELLNYTNDLWSGCTSGGYYDEMIRRYYEYTEEKAAVKFNEQEEFHSDSVAIRENLLRKKALGKRVPNSVDEPIPDFYYRVTEDISMAVEAALGTYVEDNNKAQKIIARDYKKAYGANALEFDSESGAFNAYTKSREEALRLEMFLYTKYIKPAMDTWFVGELVTVDEDAEEEDV